MAWFVAGLVPRGARALLDHRLSHGCPESRGGRLRRVQLCGRRARSGLIHVKKLLTDQAVLDRHFAFAHLAGWRAAWPSLGIGDRNLLIYHVWEPRRS